MSLWGEAEEVAAGRRLGGGRQECPRSDGLAAVLAVVWRLGVEGVVFGYGDGVL